MAMVPGLATKLEALIALGRTSQAEEAVTRLLQLGTYLEPFALRTLGLARSDRTLTEQAVERFDAMGLDWHAAETRALASPRRRRHRLPPRAIERPPW
jgi:DNA-binding SARP family transcriptional activator